MGARVRALFGLLGFVVTTWILFLGVFAAIDFAKRGREDVVVVGSKGFSESWVLAEMIAQLIEDRTDLVVERRTNLGGTHICFQALLGGEIDVYPEYTGTGMVAILEETAPSDPDAVLTHVRDEFASRYGLVWLEPLAFDNAYTVTMARARAEELGIDEISDIADHLDLVAGFTPEFLARDDGYPGLVRSYDFELANTPRAMEAGLMYEAAASGEVDLISAYATDARIDKFDLLVLEDDREFFPPYQATPLIRQDTLLRHPELREVLSALGGRVDDLEMRRLNGAVDIDRRSPAAVAADYLSHSGLR